MFLSIRYKLQSLFSSGWSRWIDINYVIREERTGMYVHPMIYKLSLLQMKVNSKSGSRKFKFIDITDSFHKEDLTELAKGMPLKLTIRNICE